MQNAVRETRTQKGLNQAELARQADVYYSLLSRIELGQRPSLPVATRIADVLGVTVESLFPNQKLRGW